MSFDAPLPELISPDWREALSISGREGYGTGSYDAPDSSDPSYFVLTRTRFSGGQAVETNEYPFFGGWSNDALNEQPQKIRIEGVLQGPQILQRRNALVERLRVPTSDDTPGHLVLPLWGRFSVVVADYEVSDEVTKSGAIEFWIACVRTGIAEAVRAEPSTVPDLEVSREAFSAAAQAAFIEELTDETTAIDTLRAGCAKIAGKLLSVVGRIQGLQSTLNDVTNSVNSITNLVNQGISSPAQFASAIYSAVTAIVSGVLGTGLSVMDTWDTIQNLWSATTDSEESAIRVASTFLSASGVSFDDIAVATVKEQATKAATENLYRTVALYGSAALLPAVPNLTATRAESYVSLFQALEESIDRTDPGLYTAAVELRIALLQELSILGLVREKRVSIVQPLPVLVLAAHLGVTYEQVIRLNPRLRDQFTVTGEVVYV